MTARQLPKIAIVGRPNVGKSSLLNRLAGERISIVDPTPGVTRDRVSTFVEIAAPTDTSKGTPTKHAELIDTGGYGVYTAEGQRFDDVGADLSTLTADIERQIRTAIREADIILFTIDAQSGITALDKTIAKLLRESGQSKRVMPIANKVDGEKLVSHGLEAAALGFGEPLCVSAENGFGVRILMETLWEKLPASSAKPQSTETEDAEQAQPESQSIKVAVVGKRNSGKSTLINAWAGEPRVIVSEIAGTTRDSVDVRLELDGRTITAIDTAGLRKRKSFADDIEFYAHSRMIAAIKRSDVAILLIDGTAEVSQVDQKLAQELQEQFKPTIIVINKWDLVRKQKKKVRPEDFEKYLTQQLRGLEYAPIVFISAASGEGLSDLASMVFNLHAQANHRETTHRLNDAVQAIMSQRGPSSRGGARAKVLYVSQVAVAPPTIVFKVNEPKLFHGRYERYLENELRELLPFSEVPMKPLFRKRERAQLGEMKQRGRTAARKRAS